LNISLCGTKEAVPNLLTTGFKHENFVVQKGTIPNLLTSWFAHATFVVPFLSHLTSRFAHETFVVLKWL
jgi:hypothetical protein